MTLEVYGLNVSSDGSVSVDPSGTTGGVGITPLGGLYTTLINKTGAPSVAGTIVVPSSTTDYAFALAADAYDAIGVVYESGIADGQPCKMVYYGITDVLLKDTTGATHGNWVSSSDTAGRALAAAMPAPPAQDTHFKEIGHCLQTVVGGSDKMCRCIVHFN